MDKGVDVHAQANPTQLEYLRKSYRKKKVVRFLYHLYVEYFFRKNTRNH